MSALTDALSMFQDSPLYNQINKTVNQFGMNLPRQIVSPLPEKDTLDTPSKLYYVNTNQNKMQEAQQYQQGIKNKAIPTPTPYPDFEYPEWMANTPIGKIPVGTPKTNSNLVALGQSPSRVTQNQSQYPEFQQFTTAPIPTNLQTLIYTSAKKAGIHPALLASILFTEHGFIVDNNRTYNRDKQGNIIPNNYDRGVAQINSAAHPNITDEQAFDANFAIPWAAQYIANNIKQLGDINRGIAAYNVGAGGARVRGNTPSGLGPKGDTYLNKVANGLTEQFRKELGIILGAS